MGLAQEDFISHAAHYYLCALFHSQNTNTRAEKSILISSPPCLVFWSKEQIKKWLHSVDTIAETSANALALALSMHQYWDKALFALQPMVVNSEKTEMKLRFYWLKPASPLAQGSSFPLPVEITEDYMVDPPILADRLEAGGRDHHENVPKAVLMLFNCQARKIVCSGDEIILTTPDPVHLTLLLSQCHNSEVINNIWIWISDGGSNH